MMYWEDIDMVLPEFKTNNDKKQLGRLIKTITIVVMGGAFGKLIFFKF